MIFIKSSCVTPSPQAYFSPQSKFRSDSPDLASQCHHIGAACSGFSAVMIYDRCLGEARTLFKSNPHRYAGPQKQQNSKNRHHLYHRCSETRHCLGFPSEHSGISDPGVHGSTNGLHTPSFQYGGLICSNRYLDCIRASPCLVHCSTAFQLATTCFAMT